MFWLLFWINIHYSGPVGEQKGSTGYDVWNYSAGGLGPGSRLTIRLGASTGIMKHRHLSREKRKSILCRWMRSIDLFFVFSDLGKLLMQCGWPGSATGPEHIGLEEAEAGLGFV